MVLILVLDKEEIEQRRKQHNYTCKESEVEQADLLAYQLDNDEYKIVQSKYGFNDTVDEQTLHEIVQCHLNYLSEGEE
jgi:hypothetical protein